MPFFLLVSALRHLPATRVAIISMLEPVVATVVAWAWLGESLTATSSPARCVVLAAIVLAQTRALSRCFLIAKMGPSAYWHEARKRR